MAFIIIYKGDIEWHRTHNILKFVWENGCVEKDVSVPVNTLLWGQKQGIYSICVR